MKHASPSISKTILRSQSGQGLTEYLILLILVAVVSIAGVTHFGKAVNNRLKEAEDQVEGLSVDIKKNTK